MTSINLRLECAFESDVDVIDHRHDADNGRHWLALIA